MTNLLFILLLVVGCDFFNPKECSVELTSCDDINDYIEGTSKYYCAQTYINTGDSRLRRVEWEIYIEYSDFQFDEDEAALSGYLIPPGDSVTTNSYFYLWNYSGNPGDVTLFERNLISVECEDD